MTGPERWIDERLRRAYTPPLDVGTRARRAVERARGEGDDRPGSWLHGLAAAAALLIGGLAPLWWPAPPAGPPAPGPPLAAGQRWCSDPRADALARELDPLGLFACTAPGPGGAADEEAVGCTSPGLALSSWPALPGLAGLVWDPDPGLVWTGPEPWPREPGGRLLRLRRGAEQALVLIHARAQAPTLASAPSDAVRVHRREVGAWVLHELTPAATPRFLSLFAAIE